MEEQVNDMASKMKQISVESNSSWGQPLQPSSMPPIPETGPPVGLTTDEEDSDSEDLPPGKTLTLYLDFDLIIIMFSRNGATHGTSPNHQCS